MPRQRMHKPELITHGGFTECSVSAQLLIILIQNFCDDNGNHPAHLRSIKAQVFPAHDFTLEQVGEFVQELLDHELLIEYEVENKRFYHILGWEIEGHPLHQTINRPAPPTCPLYDDSLRAHGVLSDDSLISKDKVSKVKSSKGKLSKDNPSPKSLLTQKVFEHWVDVMKPKRATLTPTIEKLIKAQLKIFSIEEICLAIDGCIHSDFLMGRSPDSNGEKYNTLEYIFRDKHFQKLIEYAESPPILKPIASQRLSKDDERRMKNKQAAIEFLED